MVEIWKPVTIPNYSEHYEVSSQGRVRRVAPSGKYKAHGLLRGTVTRKGYISMKLTANNSPITIKLHRLVAAAFLGPPPTGLQVNHKDGNKANNAVENLEYVTLAENIKHRDAHGLNHIPVGENNGSAKLTESDVLAIRHRYAMGGVSKKQLAMEYGVSGATVGFCIAGKTWKHLPIWS